MASILNVDQINNAAGTSAMSIDSSGNVGVGTTSPDVVNHIVGADGKTTLASHDAQTVAVVENNADAQFAIVANSGSSSQLFFGDEDNELVGRIRYDHSSNDMRFYTNSGEYLKLTGGGVFEVLGSTDTYNIEFLRSGTSRYIVHTIDPANGPGYTYQIFREGSTTRGSISLTSSGVSYATSSDYRLKENLTADWDATPRLKQLNPVRFNLIDYPNNTVDGFLAHEVQTVVPEAVTGTHNEVDDDGNPVYQGIDQSKLVPLLVKTIQELEARVAALENA